ncbi:MAG: hypothetical protein CTY22_10105 [Methylomonas sp.]|nr:MAG: hypothetical protein CTY23_05710 [Methylomonas sp.]PPD24953.1 MAG: hypothetical protein CTY22_10105 [Methylomonas sp.]PPD34138.1 MAG: hypothetical protein CTY21_10085 [Methylomonas sp.]PPD41415.1 MAG: hypothetical protein CTY17_03755 [Methylomonas sp.]PPD52336.1 MAG: hypothetical protein CTY11_09585 [Methylomonas sp.]
MTLPEMIYLHSLKLPDAAAREALDFIEFLEQRYGLEQVAIQHRIQRKAGSAKGVFQIIEDDENHLTDFKEYMP